MRLPGENAGVAAAVDSHAQGRYEHSLLDTVVVAPYSAVAVAAALSVERIEMIADEEHCDFVVAGDDTVVGNSVVDADADTAAAAAAVVVVVADSVVVVVAAAADSSLRWFAVEGTAAGGMAQSMTGSSLTDRRLRDGQMTFCFQKTADEDRVDPPRYNYLTMLISIVQFLPLSSW